MHILLVEATLEGWICQDQVERVASKLREAFRERIAEGVLVVDARLVNSVKHEVHRGDPEHRHVEVETVEHPASELVAFLPTELVAAVGDMLVAVDLLDDLATL